MKTVGFIGGDSRQITLMNNFAGNGYNVKIYGYENAENAVNDIEQIYGCDIIVFPMPSCRGNKIFAPFSEYEICVEKIKIPSGKYIFYAGGNELLEKKIAKSGSVFFDCMKREELIIKNAVPTAEGAVEIAISETPYTLFGSEVLVTGFGRVAKALVCALKGLGAKVTVAARRCSAIAEAESLGCAGIDIGNLVFEANRYDIIFNTVPAILIDECVLRNVKQDVLIIDLASKPGGVDFEAARRLGKNVIWALSLPGKIAPVTAGNIIFETIMNILRENGVN